jgi:RimJ/RimL family protein N-acetyltransferase
MGNFKLLPIRDEDKYEIMNWRNAQVRILRQKSVLTNQQQEKYFKEVVAKLFEAEKPEQLLFSLLENDILIGYGGLVHIDWESRNGEVSFLTDTSRTVNSNRFIADWKEYLCLIKQVALYELAFAKIYTYAYDIRPHLYAVLKESGFVKEARLRNHVSIGNSYYDVLIHSCFAENISLRLAEPDDLMTYFNWANDREVRQNSFNPAGIELEAHTKWFLNKLESSATLMFIASSSGIDVGQIRFDEVGPNQVEIGFSIDKDSRGKGFGSKLIKAGMQRLLAMNPGIQRVVAKVKSENVASKKAFLSAGFKLAHENEQGVDVFYYDPGELISFTQPEPRSPV